MQALIPCQVIRPATLARSRYSTSSAGHDAKGSRPATSWATGNICEVGANRIMDAGCWDPSGRQSKAQTLLIIAPQRWQLTLQRPWTQNIGSLDQVKQCTSCAPLSIWRAEKFSAARPKRDELGMQVVALSTLAIHR